MTWFNVIKLPPAQNIKGYSKHCMMVVWLQMLCYLLDNPFWNSGASMRYRLLDFWGLLKAALLKTSYIIMYPGTLCNPTPTPVGCISRGSGQFDKTFEERDIYVDAHMSKDFNSYQLL